jgi:hypothetical protein
MADGGWRMPNPLMVDARSGHQPYAIGPQPSAIKNEAWLEKLS